MRDDLRHLLEIARLDEELANLAGQAEQIPGRRTALEQGRLDARARLDQAQADLLASERRQRDLEVVLADAEAQLARLDAQQYEVNSREAYEALHREMGVLRQTISTRETEILELMERIEAAQRSVADQQVDLRQQEARVDEQLGEQEALGERLAKEVGRLEGARAELAARVKRSLLEAYERIAARRRPAAVAVSSEVCPGCRVGIPPQLYLELLAGRELVTCGSCHRILIHERLLES